MEPMISPASSPKRARNIGLVLGGVAIALFLVGVLGFWNSSKYMRRDPGLTYRNPTTLDKMLARAQAAEEAGDRGSAITAYRFVIAVGAGDDPELKPYIAAARRGLARLGYPMPPESTRISAPPAPPP